MRNLLLLSLFALSLTLLPKPASAEPLTWWRWRGDPVRAQAALDCALPRWRAATGLPIDVSYYPSHYVGLYPVDKLPAGHVGHSWGSWPTAQTMILESMSDEWVCQAFVHEMSHLLRRTNDHVGTDGSISYATIHLWSRIDAQDIAAVCAVQNCTCSNPETP